MRTFEENSPNWGSQQTWYWKGLYCHWRVLGEQNKTALLFIHGFGASSDHWRYNAEFFAKQGFRVYALDLVGFGKSEQPSSNKLKYLDNHLWSIQVVDFIKVIMQKSEGEKVIILGNSLGGLTGITSAAFNSELISAVIAFPLPDPALMGSINLALPGWVEKSRRCITYFLFKLIPLELIIPLIIKTELINSALQLAYNKSIKQDIELKNIIKKPAQRAFAANALRAMCVGMSSRSERFKAPSLLKNLANNSLRPPILLVWGREDKLVPLIIGKSLIKRYPWLELLVLEKTGHCPHDESPYEFNQYVLNWLNANL